MECDHDNIRPSYHVDSQPDSSSSEEEEESDDESLLADCLEEDDDDDDATALVAAPDIVFGSQNIWTLPSMKSSKSQSSRSRSFTSLVALSGGIFRLGEGRGREVESFGGEELGEDEEREREGGTLKDWEEARNW